MLRKFFFMSMTMIMSLVYLSAQDVHINTEYMKGYWPSAWISHPDATAKGYGVYHFRKVFEVPKNVDNFIIHVSADNRYILYVNNQIVTRGPARGDRFNWYFESVDIAPYLKAGENIIAATVWNMSDLAPVAQITDQTGFVVQGNSEKEQIVNTNSTWKAYINNAYKPCSTDNGSRLKVYMVIGPGDEIDGSKYPWGWQKTDYDDSGWKQAKFVDVPTNVGYGTNNSWNLTPRNIPLMEETLQRMQKIRRSEGVSVNNNLLTGDKPTIIPSNHKVRILIDQGHNTVAYPVIKLSGGKNALVKVSYAEALFDKDMQKGNRDEVEGRELHGNYDIFTAEGGDDRIYSPLWLRTYRYLELEIETKDDALELQDIYGLYSGYPFKQVATFESNDKSMSDIWDVGWRTARLCAGETYYDCPYYEQLQYPGDTRIQALISLYVTGDDRLMKKAILDFYNSRVPEGLTQGRYPSNKLQVIPPYALFWVSMIYDYWMHCQDEEFVAQFLPAINGIIAWYEHNIDNEKNMLGGMKWWNFTDYTDVFPQGVAPGSDDGNSSLLTLHFAYTLKQAAKLFNHFNRINEGYRLLQLADRMCTGTYNHCFDESRMLMADTPDKETYSQHSSIMAILSEAIVTQDRKEVMKRVVNDKDLGPVTFYYRFYLTQALKKSGMGDLYYSSLHYWRDMLKLGLTTFAEKPEPARSDCHAWSASPLYDYFSIICGINPSSQGFKKVEIAPSLGDLKVISASIPHPEGEIKVDLKRKGEKGIEGSVTLPKGITGTFLWGNFTLNLQEGYQRILL